MLEKLKKKITQKKDAETEYEKLPLEIRERIDSEADKRWKQKLDFLALLGIEDDTGFSKHLPLVNVAVSVLLLLVLIFKK